MTDQMSGEENRLKWNEFVEIGNNVQKAVSKEYRIRSAKYALLLSDDLIDNRFIVNLPAKDRQLYLTLLPKLAEYLDVNIKVIQAAVRECFLIQHYKSGHGDSPFDISFAPKQCGIQDGLICTVVSEGKSSGIRYFVKTHRMAQTSTTQKAKKKPDTKELFVYKLLQLIGMGPEVHFIIPSHVTKKTIYIATKDCHLVLVSGLSENTVNNTALLQLDLVSRILCLSDCSTNSSNCGQVGEKPMIVDFWIKTQSWGYFQRDIFNITYQYPGLMEAALKNTDDVKMDIMKQSLHEWDLLKNIEIAELEILELVKRCEGVLQFEDDLKLYVKGIKETIKVLANS